MIRIVILGLICTLILSCSDKQKEADRLAADLKAMQTKGDSAKDTSSGTSEGISADTLVTAPEPGKDSLSALVDSMVRQSIGDSQQVNVPEQTVKLDTAVGGRPIDQDNSGASIGNTTSAEPIMPPRPVDDGYVVQIASTTDRDEAKEIVARFAGYGYPAFPQAAQVDGAVWYRVRVGPYPTSKQASDVLAELNQKYQVTGWVAKHN